MKCSIADVKGREDWGRENSQVFREIPPTNVWVITDSCVEPFAEGNGPPMILLIVVVVAAAAGVVVVPGQGKAGKTGRGQTKPRQGTTSKPAKPRPES